MQNKELPETRFQLKKIQDRFYKVNRQRLSNTGEILQGQQKDFFDLLPLLFHVNDPELPGYISDKTPSGISQYSPLHVSLKVAKRHFKSYKHNRRARHQMDIHAMFFMGSSGTIAYTQKSDFDVWLIHSPELDSAQCEELAEKAKAVEQWAESLKLEVHFFIFDVDSFRSGQHQSLSIESSGSTQHYLLLDEFYRSSLLVAGRFPLWWLVPPEQEENYDEYVKLLFYGNLVDEADVIDLGKSSPVPANEFFGAAVWQLYKGIHSPYKSVLKLLLMEVYASEHPEIELLSTCYKRSIYQDKTDISVLDPYIIMYKKVEEYLMCRNDHQRLNIFRECFYFKIGEKLSKPVQKNNDNWRRSLLEDLMLSWGWEQSNFTLLDMYDSWRIDDVMKQRDNLTKTLTDSYRFLSDFARRYADVYRVSQTELNVLGRKLYAAFEKKNGKVEIINHGFNPDMIETEITIQQARNQDGQNVWLLYRGKIAINKLREFRPLKRTHDIMELLVWCHLNQVVNLHSAISLHTIDHGISTKEIKDTFYALNKLFPSAKVYEPDFNDLSQPARITSAGIFINVGNDPLSKNKEGGRHVTSSRMNALSYGAQHRNLALCFDLILITSWEEVLVYHYEGLNGLMQCLCDYIAWSPKNDHMPSISSYVFCLSSSYGQAISQRIESLFREVVSQCCYKNRSGKDSRFIIESEDNYYVLEFNSDKPAFKSFPSIDSLYRYLSMPVNNFCLVFFDSNNNWDSHIQSLYKLNQESVIQIFYRINGKRIHVDILDEKGSLFSHTMPYYNSQSLISHYSQFFISILNRKNFITGEIIDINSIGIDFYEIQQSNTKKYNIVKINVKPNPYSNSFFNVKVIGSLDDNEENALTVYCDDMEFSSLEYGSGLLSVVAEYVLSKRKNGQRYPIYITDIDFSRGLLDIIEPKKLQSVHFLNYKKKVEEKLNTALKNVILAPTAKIAQS